MNIKIGEIYNNRTFRYLLPCLRGYGPTFISKLGSVFKLGVGIGDEYLDREDLKQERLLFILIDKKYRPAFFDSFINYLRLQKFYVTDYPFDDILLGRKHMIVIEIPSQYYQSYDYFIEGKYSHMYLKKELDIIYSDNLLATNSIWRDSKLVLLRHKSLIDPFIKKIKERFGSELTITREDLVDAELDFPIDKKQEIFNYGKMENRA